MEGNNHNDPNNPNNNPNQQYPYNQYPNYYYQQYYNVPQPQIPQGDPSAALSSMVYQLQQQTQQRQALGAMAAASISSVLGNREQPTDYYGDYYAGQNQRSVINYDDLSQAGNNTTKVTTQEAVKKEEAENPDSPSAKKPKFCCNRWLKSAIAVAQHEKLHIKCPSCDHMCLKSALQEHEENFHGKEKKESDKKPSRPDGIVPVNAPRIETPEDLEAWIAARKNNWPSKANVERKGQEDAEKEARGELPNKKRTANRKRDQQNAKKQKLEEKKNSLVAQYDSDSDSEDDMMDPEKDAISSKDPSAMGRILLPEDRPKRKCRYFMMGKCNKGDQCGFSHEKPEPKPKQPRPAPTYKKRPNLLFKLLEKEILQEKNVILQCLRYIVDNNYFGEGDSNTTAPTITAQPEIDGDKLTEKDNTEPEKETSDIINSSSSTTAAVTEQSDTDQNSLNQDIPALDESDVTDQPEIVEVPTSISTKDA